MTELVLDLAPPGADSTPCEDCGAPLGGRSGCDRAFHALGARAVGDAAFAHRRRAVVDAYSLQHSAYIRSVKSLAAHLCGLCAAVERPADPRASRAIWSELSVPPDAAKPALPIRTAERTLADAMRAPAGEFSAAVDAWIEAVWAAWSAHHELARAWLDYSIANLPRR